MLATGEVLRGITPITLGIREIARITAGTKGLAFVGVRIMVTLCFVAIH
jgi:hypothetical protein